MKKFLVFIITLFLGSLFFFITGKLNPTFAQVPDGGPCVVATADMCDSNSCPFSYLAPPAPPTFLPIPMGFCAPSAKSGAINNGAQSGGQSQTQPAAPPCAVDPNTTGGKCTTVRTAFGPIEVEPGAFISSVFGILLAAAGTIAVILFIRAGYQIMTARGNPEGIKEGRERIVAAIVGLMFLIFSFVLLQVIGVDLLRLPQ